MKHGIKHTTLPVTALFLITILLYSCSKSGEEEEASGLTVATNTATNIGRGWATLNGSVNASDKTCSMSFEYSLSTDFSNSVVATPATASGDTSRQVYATLTGLEAGKQYFYRLKAVYAGGEKHGLDMSFTTTTPKNFTAIFNPDLNYGSVTDIDGNTYRTITIGSSTWMAENMRTTRYNDGTAIPFVPVPNAWVTLTTPGYCWYNSDSTGYGALYNWHAISTGNICPAGWHVPEDSEWSALIESLGGEGVAGARLKEAGTIHWTLPNYGATNETGFTALPGGYRGTTGLFGSIKHKGYWWSATESSSAQAWYRAMGYNYSNTDRTSAGKVSGFSVRCIRDN